MPKNKLKTFNQFILESKWAFNYELPDYVTKLSKIPGDTSISDQLTALNTLMVRLSDTYNYNRERRGINEDHYALDMKIHVWPDLQKWAKAKGIEDIEEDTESHENSMNDDWYRFMVDIFNTTAEDYVESFDWITSVKVGGRSGGWLLLCVDTDQSDFESDLNSNLEDYLNKVTWFDNMQALINIKKFLSDEEPDDTDAILRDLGLANNYDDEDIQYVEGIIESRNELLKCITDSITYNTELEKDLIKITGEILEFKNKAEEQFYEWLVDM